MSEALDLRLKPPTTEASRPRWEQLHCDGVPQGTHEILRVGRG